MTRRWAALATLACALVLGAMPATAAAASKRAWRFYAGAGKADITPPAAGSPAAAAVDDQFAPEFAACAAAGFPTQGRFALQEPFEDLNGDGQWDAGTDLSNGPDGKKPDPFCDVNANGRWDGLWMDNEKGPATGVNDPIDVRAVAISDGRHLPVVYASADAIGIFDYYTEQARYDLLHHYRVHALLVVSADHNESSPDTIGLYGALDTPLGVGVRSGIDEFYMRFLDDRIAQAAAAAVHHLRPAALFANQVEGQIPDGTQGDTYPMQPGITEHISDQFPTAVALPGDDRVAAVDPKLGVLQARTPSGTPIFTLISIAAHNQEMGNAGAEISADWPGAMVQSFDRHNTGTAMFLVGDNGSMEDPQTNPTVIPGGSENHSNDATQYQQAQATGARFAEIAQSAAASAVKLNPGPVRLFRRQICIPLENNGFLVLAAAGEFGRRQAWVCDTSGNPVAPLPNGSIVPTAGANFRTFVSYTDVGPDLQLIDNPGEAFPALMLGSPFGVEEESCNRPNPAVPTWHANAPVPLPGRPGRRPHWVPDPRLGVCERHARAVQQRHLLPGHERPWAQARVRVGRTDLGQRRRQHAGIAARPPARSERPHRRGPVRAAQRELLALAHGRSRCPDRGGREQRAGSGRRRADRCSGDASLRVTASRCARSVHGLRRPAPGPPGHHHARDHGAGARRLRRGALLPQRVPVARHLAPAGWRDLRDVLASSQSMPVADAAWRAGTPAGRRRGGWTPCRERHGLSAPTIPAMPRFAERPDDVFRALNDSIAFDARLSSCDLAQSRAHARMLAAQEIISQAERDQLLAGLDQVEAEIEDGEFSIGPEDEDIHMAIERRVTEIVGPVGGKLHTARSRNDQVATDMALFVWDRSLAATEAIKALGETLIALAERHLDWAMPGYTHLQRAQPVYLSHHLLAYVWMLVRDHERFTAAIKASQVLPLGAGALAGVNFETDREMVAQELGFTSVSENSIDAVSNRDFVLDYLAAAATCATHLSRLGAEIVLWSSQEFGFCELSDAWASGSSLMPQKKNPDAAELLRAKAPRVAGHLVALHGVLHGLPLTYNKDLQEDKEHLFDAADTLELSLQAAQGMLSGVKFNRERLAQAAADEFLAATDLADLLVKDGIPFREAHGIIGGLVRSALERGKQLSELSRDELAEHSPLLDERVYELLAAGAWMEGKVSRGGTSSERVREQLERARAALA